MAYPFPHLLLTNLLALSVAAGTSAETIKEGQILLTDRNLNAIGDAASTSAADLQTLNVVQGLDDGKPEISIGIPVERIVGKVNYQKYKAPVAQVFTLTTSAMSAAGADKDTFITLKVVRTDDKTDSIVGNGELATQNFYGTGAAAKQAALLSLYKQLQRKSYSKAFTVAMPDVDTLVITGGPQGYDEVGSLSTPCLEVYVSYEHTTGSKITSSTTYAVGVGTGLQVVQLEQSQSDQDDRFSAIPKSFVGLAKRDGKYNMYTITFRTEFMGDFNKPDAYYVSITVAFLTTDGTPSTQEAAFRTALAAAIPKALDHSDADTSDEIEPAGDAANNPGAGGDGIGA